MPKPSIRTDLNEAADILVDLSPQIAFGNVLPVDELPDPVYLGFAKLIHPRRRVRIDIRLLEYFFGDLGANTIYAAQSNVSFFPIRNVDASDTNHGRTPLQTRYWLLFSLVSGRACG
jgi:hypothetical protein